MIFNKDNKALFLSCEEVIATYGDTIYKVALSTMKNESDAQDIYQEVFLRYVKNKKPFDSKEHLKAWFIRVTLNCCNTMFKQKSKKEGLPLIMDIPFEEKEEKGIIFLVNELEDSYRIVIHLFYYEQYSIKEIASILHEKEGAIKTRLSRARVILKQRWEEEGYAR